MCGIAGFVERDVLGAGIAAEEQTAVLDRMCRMMAHRGPDDRGHLRRTAASRSACAGSRIIDLEGGQQPISDEDGTSHDRLQRRDLQLPGAASASWKRAATRSTPHSRHGDHRSRLRRVRRSVRRPSARHVRVRYLGRRGTSSFSSRATASAKSRSITRSDRRRARLRLGAEIAARASGCRARDRRGSARCLSLIRLRARPAYAFFAAFTNSRPGIT